MKALKAAKFLMLAAIVFALGAVAPLAAYADDGEGVTVYFTVSDDGEFVTGCDGTVLANVPVEVEYFDLEEYGLERFAYEQAGERPTLLHLFIRATEKYYFGQKMTPDDFDYVEKAMWVTNSPGSLYLKAFWGHDENLLYHVNDEYPMDGSTGIGATCDRIVLEEGDTVDLAMFTNWGISSTGTFSYFANRRFDAVVGEDVVLEGKSTGGMMSGAAISKTAMHNAEIRVSGDGGYTWAGDAAVADGEGRATLRFDAPGTYLVSAGPAFPGYESRIGVNYRCVAPPIAVVNVAGEALTPFQVSFESCGGSSVASQSVARNGTCSRPDDPTRSGYAFGGWFEDRGLTLEYDFGRAVTSDLTLYAKWERDAGGREGPGDGSGDAAGKPEGASGKPGDTADTSSAAVNYTPGKASIKSLKAGVGKLTVKWKKVAKASGYRVQVRLLKQKGVKKAGKWKTYKVGAKKLSKVIKKLKAGRLYQVRVRAYRTVEGKTYLGKWSKAKKARVKSVTTTLRAY